MDALMALAISSKTTNTIGGGTSGSVLAHGSAIEDVFSATPYTGTGAAQNINTGIDLTELSGNGGLVWIKDRSNSGNHTLIDTLRGAGNCIFSNLNNPQTSYSDTLTNFSVNGFGLGVDTSAFVNTNANNYISWTFARAPKFFDIVEYVGNGTTQVLNHALGITPGMVIIKNVSAAGHWCTWHRSLTSGNNYVLLDSTGVQAAAAINFGNNTTQVAPTSTQFTVGSGSDVNTSGNTYIAYIFAHDPSATGMIQCGSFTTDGSGNATITLGWETQYILTKRIDTADNWRVVDTVRGAYGYGVGQGSYELQPNTTAGESALSGDAWPTSTGFMENGYTTGSTVIYMAIRKAPMRVPTSGTQVYNAIARTGTGAVAPVTGVGFAPDLVISDPRNGIGASGFFDKLRGPPAFIRSNSAGDEQSSSNSILSFDLDGITLGADSIGYQLTNYSSVAYIEYFFKRAPGFFDEICYNSSGGIELVYHNLNVVPELIIGKACNNPCNWYVYASSMGNVSYLVLNTTAAVVTSSLSSPWNNADPTSTYFTPTNALNSSVVYTYVAYLFASLPGISKIGSYTGNGTNQTINCGFTSGARFILIKRTDALGDWYIWDSVRGISSAGTNDPHLSLNTPTAEVTSDDSISASSIGFGVIQNTSTNININGGNYIFLAIA